jgi:2-deoxy-D-gluconate 3-dehydrogenase
MTAITPDVPPSRGRFDLGGKVAIVTGGNGGIGLGIAVGLAEAGARIMIAGRDRAKNDAAVEIVGRHAEAAAMRVDITDEPSCRALVEETARSFGGVDILVNNAGVNLRKDPHAYTLAEWARIIDTNLTSAFVLCQLVYPAMRARGGGKIINIGSMSSIFGLGFAAPYAASKGGLVQLTRSLAISWAPDSIQVNAILPGWIDTELTRGGRRDMPGIEESVVARTPAGRWGNPEELAGAAVFLASPASDFVTGTAIPVDGGFSVKG